MPDWRAPPASLPALDERQAEAVTAPSGPLLVLAGAGAGKTRVLTERAARLARDQGAEAVLAITFTNRAAQELRTRLSGLIGQGAGERMTVGTFHAICHRMLRRHARRAGRTPAFSVYDGQASRRLLAQALEEEGAGAELPVALCQHQLGQARARLLTPAGYRKLGGGERVRVIAAAWERYLSALKRSDALDFDELLVRAVALLGEPDLLARYRSAYGAVLVDEYQDTNHAQHEWLRRLCGAHRNLTVVGDDDQAVYGWRGAQVEHVLGFERDYPGARVIALERNYRSSGAIVAAGARLAAHNERRGQKTMWTQASDGAAVALAACADEADEARQAAIWCRALIERGVEAGEIAVLFRTRAQARQLEDALLLAGVPCRVVGGQGLWETAAVRDLAAHLTLLVNRRDRVALARALGCQPGVGPVTVARVIAAGEQAGGDLLIACREASKLGGLRGRAAAATEAFGVALAELGRTLQRDGLAAACIEAVLRCGIAERLGDERCERADEQLERLRRFCCAARHYEQHAESPTLAEFLAQAALSSGEGAEPAKAIVTLSTLHGAKGGEWDHVRITGMCEGLLPHRRAIERGELEEERRLAYVGITRARLELSLSWPGWREGRFCCASRFLAEAGVAERDTRQAA